MYAGIINKLLFIECTKWGGQQKINPPTPYTISIFPHKVNSAVSISIKENISWLTVALFLCKYIPNVCVWCR